MSDCSDEKPCAVCSGGGEACELAKVRAKSEERRRLLEEGQLHPDAFARARCFGCGRRPCAKECEVAAALREDV